MNDSYATKERRALIIKKLDAEKEVSVVQLSIDFHISEVTIRKDLKELQRRNLLIRTRGGAIRIPKMTNDVDANIDHKRLYNFREKQVIGQLAATLINEGETILIDSGTTTLELAKNLDQFQNLTIITNALNIAVELSKYNRFNVILLGGHLRSSSLSTVGPLAETTLKNFYCDKCFLGVDSFHIERGISTPNLEEANINQTMMDMSKETIVMFDSTKFNKRAFSFIAPITRLHGIVTDNGISSDMRTQIKGLGVPLYIANLRAYNQ